MKKKILFAFILISIPVLVLTDYYNRKNNYPNLPKDEKWEFVKERVFSKH